MDYETIKYEVSERILTITLNRPERLNAFNEQMRREIADAVDRADADDDVRVIIFTGEGRGFCAGADLAAGGDTFDHKARGEARTEVGEHRDGGGLLTLRLYEVNKPMIAAINGPAVGIGVTMTLPMDIRLASESARIGFVFSRRGIVMEACSSWFLPRVVGISRAAEWAYSGRVFPASEAWEGGLVREVVPDDQLLPRARQIASEIAENTSAVSVALMRHMMWKMLGADHPMEAHKIDSRGVTATGRMADAKEGVSSFLEKRPAEYSLSAATDMPDFFPWWEEREFS
ncbi:MAG: crotonase/enoyl-CoA hydratase family protein [Actinomycetia bacterium]|nr:crotonase/enoyl-CoA hydratase family protein [Actinomycetes bacterium]